MEDWGLGIGPNPQSPIPNPQSPIPILKVIIHSFLNKISKIIYELKIIIKLLNEFKTPKFHQKYPDID